MTTAGHSDPGLIQLAIISIYLVGLIVIGLVSRVVGRRTSNDYFLASRGIGPILLVLSVFGTTMTAFAIQGSSGEAWVSGVSVYGKMASWSGIVHAACFFLVGAKLWALGKRFDYQTQVQFFRDRFASHRLGTLLFCILALLQVPYIVIGMIGTGNMISVATAGTFPDWFPASGSSHGSIPYWLGTLAGAGVVLFYVYSGGARATLWANAAQTVVFLVVGIVTFVLVADRLGGAVEATRTVQRINPTKFTRGVTDDHIKHYEDARAGIPVTAEAVEPESDEPCVVAPHRPRAMSELEFASYGFIPLSVAMFPHLFQLWLTARSARSFRLTVTLHPVLVMAIWAPCVAIGVWASAACINGHPVVPFTPDAAGANPNLVIGRVVTALGHPVVTGLLTAGVLAAILGGLDAQFLSLSSMFTHDIVDSLRTTPLTDRQRLVTARGFLLAIVLGSWLLSLALRQQKPIFGLAIWCFSGFASLFPLVIAALYWRRATRWGAYASIMAGMGSGLWFYIDAGLQHGFTSRMEPIIGGVVAAAPMTIFAAIAMIVVSLATSPPAARTVGRFFPQDG